MNEDKSKLRSNEEAAGEQAANVDASRADDVIVDSAELATESVEQYDADAKSFATSAGDIVVGLEAPVTASLAQQAAEPVANPEALSAPGHVEVARSVGANLYTLRVTLQKAVNAKTQV